MTKRELHYLGSLLKAVEESDEKTKPLEEMYEQIKIMHRSECKRRKLEE